ncbi:predicted protein [Scheffersomyces stipitis CBS 6054]|uniref:Wings apart-like protein C-terminal domain-containing protein n=1 Tax=Scheffersomyces stipitis (strain ATCC 58785 / CBS 6054 / NBRC 10063 / NRRL Y-11545) TaxID=322104 RepID=A3LZV8_PICST|nr:predicted protein [Scheffersomyces stipitis CBS 6054]ABN68607.2 predicted protein [Scheffersomyces stipitis CBS 6054]
MSVYGKNWSSFRKRTRLSADAPVFSSDEENEEFTDITEPTSVSDKLMSVIQDSHVVTKIGEQELLPSAEINSNWKTYKSVQHHKRSLSDFNLSDSLTTSPQKLVTVVNALSNSPSPVKSRAKRRLEDELKDLAKTPPRNKSKNNNREQVTPAKSTNSTAKRTPTFTPKEARDWDSLFESIDDESVGRNTFLTSQNDSDNHGEETDNDDGEINVDLSVFSSYVENSNTSPSRNSSERISKGTAKSKLRTYGDERSFLLEGNEEENSKVSIGDEIPVVEDVLSINDLRSISKENQRKEALDYILEGLQFTDCKNLATGNAVLVSLLVDLAIESIKNGSNALERNGEIIATRLLAIYENIINSKGNGKDVLCWLVSVNFLFLAASATRTEQVAISQTFRHCLLSILKSLGVTYSSNGLPILVKKSLLQLSDILQIETPLQVQLIEVMSNVPDFHRADIFEHVIQLFATETRLTNKMKLLSYIQSYVERSPELDSLYDLEICILESMNKIDFVQLDDLDVQVLKLVVVLSTSYDNNERVAELLFDPKYVSPMIRYINSSYSCLNDEYRLNIALFLLGFLINFVESDRFELQKFDDVRDNIAIFEAIDASAKDEASGHLIGYNSIVLTYLSLKYSEDLDIDIQHLKHKLDHFKEKIANTRIKTKIDSLLTELAK